MVKRTETDTCRAANRRPPERDTIRTIHRVSVIARGPLITLRFPKLIDLRADPFEKAQTDAGEYAKWRVEHAFALVPAQAYVGQHLQTYIAYPPRQRPGSFSLDQALTKLQEPGPGQQ